MFQHVDDKLCPQKAEEIDFWFDLRGEGFHRGAERSDERGVGFIRTFGIHPPARAALQAEAKSRSADAKRQLCALLKDEYATLAATLRKMKADEELNT